MKNLFQDAFSESIKKDLDKEGNAFTGALKAAEKGHKTTVKVPGTDKTIKVTGHELEKEEDKGDYIKDKMAAAKAQHKHVAHAFGQTFKVDEEKHMSAAQKKERNKIYKGLSKADVEKRYGKDIRGNIATAKALKENVLGMEAKPAPAPAAPAAEVPAGDEEAAWKKGLDPKTDPAAFDAASNPSLKLDTEGVAKAREWIKKLDDMATFINGTDDESLNAQINALEMRNSIPFKGIVRREEKRITKLAENLRGLAELFKTVVTSSGKKIHDATSKITTR